MRLCSYCGDPAEPLTWNDLKRDGWTTHPTGPVVGRVRGRVCCPDCYRELVHGIIPDIGGRAAASASPEDESP